MSNPFQDMLNIIQNKQLEYSLKLSKQLSVTLNGKVYKKRSLTSKQWRELSSLNNELAKQKDGSLEQLDILIDLRTKAALYYFSIPAEVFDENYEKLNSLLDGCVLRSNTGLSPDIDLDSLLHEYENGHSKIIKEEKEDEK